MEVQPKPLLKYAEELQQSYSRLIVYSGDILRALPEPREGLSAANFKTKKDESTAFLREWQHLESILDEYLIRLNDIRTRAHEELDAARVRCLAGADIDLTLPEAAVMLTSRLTKYKRQYDTLQKVIGGCSLEEIAEASALDTDPNLDAPVDGSSQKMDVDAVDAPRATHTDPAAAVTSAPTAAIATSAPAYSSDHNSATNQTTNQATGDNAGEPDDLEDFEEPEDTGLFEAPEEPPAAASHLQGESVIDVDVDVDAEDDSDDDVLFQGSPNADNNETIDIGSDSDIDDDAMEDIFDS
ncbi:hypothetical protein IWW50_006671 [Coemansia erecta]|nr:hypothetical protein IWW50_006671 [Coemansia erecta]